MDSNKPTGTNSNAGATSAGVDAGSKGENLAGDQQALPLESLQVSLSALMDNQADELEIRRLLRELPAQPELAACWKRYHAVRASLHQEIHSNPAVDLLPGIKARLATEVELPLALPGRLLRSGTLRFLGQGAIAASVAMAALLGVSLLQSPSTELSGSPEFAEAGQPLSPALSGDFRAAELARSAMSDPAALQRLEQAVYQGLSDLTPPEEIPVSYNPDFPLQPRPTPLPEQQ